MHPVLSEAPPCFQAPRELREMASVVLAECIGIRALWLLDHDPANTSLARAPFTLLAFADAATLQRLRRGPALCGASVSLLVVTDGDFFQAAWDSGLSGSLARWSWRQISPGEAFYDQARWSSDDGGVVRVRRKALLLWRASQDKRRAPREKRV